MEAKIKFVYARNISHSVCRCGRLAEISFEGRNFCENCARQWEQFTGILLKFPDPPQFYGKTSSMTTGFSSRVRWSRGGDLLGKIPPSIKEWIGGFWWYPEKLEKSSEKFWGQTLICLKEKALGYQGIFTKNGKLLGVRYPDGREFWN